MFGVRRTAEQRGDRRVGDGRLDPAGHQLVVGGHALVVERLIVMHRPFPRRLPAIHREPDQESPQRRIDARWNPHGRSTYRSIRGSLSGTLSAGAIHPALPQEAPAATPVRSTTATETPCSCKNHAVDNPTMPAPTTIADRGRIRWMSAIKNLPSDAVVVHGGADARSLPSTLLRPVPTR